MEYILVSSSHFDTLCTSAMKLFQEHGYGILYDPSRSFPSYSTEEILALKDRENIVAALVGLDDYRDEEKFRALPRLKALARFGVGMDNVDTALARKYGVQVFNAPGQNANAVAELAVCFMLSLLRNTVRLDAEMKAGNWSRMLGQDLKGKRVGLVGFGAIARLVAKKLSGMEVVLHACDLNPDNDAAKALGVTVTSFEDVVTRSDIVSVHIPATPETYHLFDDRIFSGMKKGTLFINTARGALVDTNALIRALDQGIVSGAALDTYETEPLPVNSPLLSRPDVILMPHTGAETVETYDRVGLYCAHALLKALGKTP